MRNKVIMKWSEIRRIAENKGWYLYRNGANHDIYIHNEKENQIIIGRHKAQEVPKNAYNRLKKQIGF
jgi:predicted RNA binding protein YcfA (HicA-like mRNA interferase family)